MKASVWEPGQVGRLGKAHDVQVTGYEGEGSERRVEKV